MFLTNSSELFLPVINGSITNIETARIDAAIRMCARRLRLVLKLLRTHMDQKPRIRCQHVSYTLYEQVLIQEHLIISQLCDYGWPEAM